MKTFIDRYSYFNCVWVLILGCFLQLGCNRARPVPGGLYAAPAVYDAGAVLDKDKIVGVFKLVNTSDKTIAIRNVKLSCGCSKVNLSKEVVTPNESIDVEITVNVKGKYGPNVFEAMVFTDSTDVPVVPLHVNANIAFRKLDGTIVMDPGQFVTEEKIHKSFTLLPGKIRSVSASNISFSPSLKANFEIRPHIASNRQNVLLEINGRAPSQKGEFSVELDLIGKGSDWGEAHVLLKGKTAPIISIPSAISMGFIEAGQTVKKQVAISEWQYLPQNDPVDDPVVILSW